MKKRSLTFALLAGVAGMAVMLAGCGQKQAATVPTNGPLLDPTAGQATQTQSGLAPAEPMDGSKSLFGNEPKTTKPIKTEQDIEDALNSIGKDSSKSMGDIDDSDLNNY